MRERIAFLQGQQTCQCRTEAQVIEAARVVIGCPAFESGSPGDL
jgi:hypothetical protein